MLAVLAAAILALVSPDEDSEIIDEVMLFEITEVERTAWFDCVDANATRVMAGLLAAGRVGDAVASGQRLCGAHENAVRGKMAARLPKDATAVEWVEELMAKARWQIKEPLVRKLAIMKIDYSQPRACLALSQSGGIPTELIQSCARYGIR